MSTVLITGASSEVGRDTTTDSDSISSAITEGIPRSGGIDDGEKAV